mmetsp:Transcript_14283/g.60178  ORF Transcript_14283/g.60178 Transcript_14283/m.60178 type:complete len:291 (-) Transcript_14283:1037-1909(-)
MYSQSASRLYLCCLVRPWSVAAAAPHPRARASTSCATYFAGSSSYPILILIVSGVDRMARDAHRTVFSHRARPSASLNKLAPAPLLQTPSMGHPMFMSTKSHCVVESRSSPTRAIKSGYPPHTCTPKHVSLVCRRTSAHSRRSPFSRLAAIAISLTVTSAPARIHARRNGMLPTVVKGATYSLPLKSGGGGNQPGRSKRPPGSETPRWPSRSAGARGAPYTRAACVRDTHFTGTPIVLSTASDRGKANAHFARSRCISSDNAFNSASFASFLILVFFGSPAFSSSEPCDP